MSCDLGLGFFETGLLLLENAYVCSGLLILSLVCERFHFFVCCLILSV